MFPQKIWKSLPYSRLSGAGRTGVGHRRWAQQRTPALSTQTELRLPSTPASAVPAFPNARPDSASHPASALPPAERRSLRRNQGGAGGIISDLAPSRRTRSSVCARHAVRLASLARRRLRLTPEVNSGCLPAVGRAPDVARGPRASRNGLPAALPPSPFASGIIFPFTLSCRSSVSCEAESGGCGGNYFPRMPFLPFTPGNRGSSRGIRPCRGRVRPASRRRRRSRGGCGRLRRGRPRYSGF